MQCSLIEGGGGGGGGDSDRRQTEIDFGSGTKKVDV